MMVLKQKVRCLIMAMTTILLISCHHNNSQRVHGYVEGDFTYIATIAAGALNSIAVKAGDSVEAGQELFSLDPEPEQSKLKQTEARLKATAARLSNVEKGMRPSEIAALNAKKEQIIARMTFAQKTVERYKPLVKKQLLERSQFDQAVADYERIRAESDEITQQIKTAHLEARIDEIHAAKAVVEEAKAAVQTAQWQFSQKQVKAPIGGQVFDVYYQMGELIPSYRPVLSLLSKENIYVVFFIEEPRLSNLSLQQKITVTCDGCQKPVAAHIRYISPKAEYTPPMIYSEKVRTDLVYRIEADIDQDADAILLHPGQPISVKLR